jgi:hypothetical protein
MIFGGDGRKFLFLLPKKIMVHPVSFLFGKVIMHTAVYLQGI